MAPQAIVMKSTGIIGGAPSGVAFIAGATSSSGTRSAPSAIGSPPKSAAPTSPATSSPSAVMSCIALM